MIPLIFILGNFLVASLIFSYLDISKKKKALEIVNDMGIGYNLGNSFVSFKYDEFGNPINISEEINSPNDQITLLGNPIPTKGLIKNIKKNGFKTIRFPVTWINFIDDFGKINSEWMSRVKEVVNWIIENNMYCILNLYHDGSPPNWLSKGISAKEKYINLWTQIADEFKDFDEYLIFESMSSVLFYVRRDYFYTYDYITFLNFTQAFVNVIRNSRGNNKERLLLIPGFNNNLELTCSDNYLMPIDPSNKFAISINYYAPTGFTSTFSNNFLISLDTWGTDADYSELITNIETLKNTYINKGIPIIIGEVGVITESNKKIESIREYLYAVFAFSSEYNGLMACLWDTSNKTLGEMNFYNRAINKWYDEKIKENLMEILKGKYIKSSEYYIITNKQTITSVDNFGNMVLKIGKNKPLTIILNAKLEGKLFVDLEFFMECCDKDGERLEIEFGENNGKKQYDGTYYFTVDVANIDCYEYIEVFIWEGADLITLNNLTVFFEEKFRSFDYKGFKYAISNKIN